MSSYRYRQAAGVDMTGAGPTSGTGCWWWRLWEWAGCTNGCCAFGRIRAWCHSCCSDALHSGHVGA